MWERKSERDRVAVWEVRTGAIPGLRQTAAVIRQERDQLGSRVKSQRVRPESIGTFAKPDGATVRWAVPSMKLEGGHRLKEKNTRKTNKINRMWWLTWT